MYSSTRWLGAATLLALVGAGQFAEAAQPTNEELHQQLQALQQTVEALKQQLQKRNEAAGGVTPSAVSSSTAEGVDEDAEPQPEVATKQDIEGVRADLENYKYDQQRNRETKTALTTRGTTLGGSVQVRAGWQNPAVNTGSTATAGRRHTSFDIPLAQLNVGGSLFRDYAEGRNLDYRLAFAYAKNSPATNNSNFNLTDAYLRYSFLPTLTGLEDPRLNITVGQQLIPFGLEAQVGEELRPVINSSQFVSALGVGTRQLGAIVRGDYKPYVDYGFNYRAPLLEYAAGVVNGSGPNKSDDNGKKDFIGRLAFTLPVDYNSIFRELKFGTSYYKGTKNLVNNNATVATGKSDRLGFDIYYNHDPFGATYEWVEGKDESLRAGRIAPSTRSRGQTLTLFYTWGEQWVKSYRGQAKYNDWWPKSYQAFYRWDSFDPDRSINNKSTVNTVGFNFFFAETTKFQVNINNYRYQDPTRPSANELLTQFQFSF